jgi:hypothetical protein
MFEFHLQYLSPWGNQEYITQNLVWMVGQQYVKPLGGDWERGVLVHVPEEEGEDEESNAQVRLDFSEPLLLKLTIKRDLMERAPSTLTPSSRVEGMYLWNTGRLRQYLVRPRDDTMLMTWRCVDLYARFYEYTFEDHVLHQVATALGVRDPTNLP